MSNPGPYRVQHLLEAKMFTRLNSLMQLRRSTAFLLNRADDRLLDDIGLTRGDIEMLGR